MNDGLDAGWPVRTPAAPRLTARQHNARARAQETVHETLRSLDSPEVVQVVHGVLSGRHDLRPADLEFLGNQLCRMAWGLERKNGRESG